ncbi:MAG: enoyl-CoA hydratase/isomerase family protein [Pseudomonadota bacterium]
MTAADHTISIGRDGDIAIVTFHRPPHNFVSIDLVRALADAFDAIDADPGCRASVLRSEGRVFCAGADLTPGTGGADGVREDFTHALYAQAARLFGARKPIVAAVQGAAVGAGLGLALVADFRIAAPEARFVANFVKLGFHPGFGITHSLPRLIGDQRAALMLLTGRRIAGETARDWGLVDQLVELDGLDDAASALAREIAENAPLAVQSTRATLRAGLVTAIRDATAIEAIRQAELRDTEDFDEGVRSVAERRPGRFTGR